MDTRWLSLALSAVAALPLAAAAQTTRHVVRGDSIAIYNLVGELRVEAGTGSDVTVEVRRSGADAARLEIQTGTIRGRETLRVVYPADLIALPEWGRGWTTTMRVRDDGTFGDHESRGDWHRRGERSGWGREVRITGRPRGDALQASADLTVAVPAGRTIALYLGVGKAFVSNVDGKIRVRGSAADIAAERTRGTLMLETGSGNVDLRDAAGDVKLESGSGDISASSVRATRGDFETGSGNVTLTDVQSTVLGVETGSGDIRVSGARGDELRFETGSGNVHVALVAAFGALDIETGSGDVTLTIPPAVGAEVDLETGSGDIDLGGITLQVRRIERDHVRGTMGDGKGRLSIETGSGNVRLVKG